MHATVLDSSALIALLSAEPGADRVRAALPDAAICTVNLSETVSVFLRRGVGEVTIRQGIGTAQVSALPFDEELAIEAGLLWPQVSPAGLSLGDRACLALARKLGARALTADRSWASIAKAVGVEIEVIR